MKSPNTTLAWHLNKKHCTQSMSLRRNHSPNQTRAILAPTLPNLHRFNSTPIHNQTFETVQNLIRPISPNIKKACLKDKASISTFIIHCLKSIVTHPHYDSKAISYIVAPYSAIQTKRSKSIQTTLCDFKPFRVPSVIPSKQSYKQTIVCDTTIVIRTATIYSSTLFTNIPHTIAPADFPYSGLSIP